MAHHAAEGSGGRLAPEDLGATLRQGDGGVLARCAREEPLTDELIDPGTRVALGDIAKGTVRVAAVVFESTDAVGRGAGEHVGHVGGAKTSPQLGHRTENRGDDLLRAVNRGHLAQTDIASTAARCWVFLTKVHSQRAMAADGVPTEGEDFTELAHSPGCRRRLGLQQ